MIDCIEASINKISWDEYQKLYYNSDSNTTGKHWTLAHGDFHPANIMWKYNTISADVGSVILDWELVGVGSGPQDLAQYLISHCDTNIRQQVEIRHLRTYYEELTSTYTNEEIDSSGSHNNKDMLKIYTWDMCIDDYISGGCERWIWLLIILSDMCPEPMTKYFHDQLLAFIVDHSITPGTIGMPRV